MDDCPNGWSRCGGLFAGVPSGYDETPAVKEQVNAQRTNDQKNTEPRYPAAAIAMINIDPSLQATLLSLTEALVAALQSEDAETAFIEASNHFVDQLGDTLTLPHSVIMNLDTIDLQGRQALLRQSCEAVGVEADSRDWHRDPQIAVRFQNYIWTYLSQRFLQTHQAVSAHVEILPNPEPEYSRPVSAPAGSWILLYVESGQCLIKGLQDTLTLGGDHPEILILPPESAVEICRSPLNSSCSLFSSAFFPRENWLPLLHSSQGPNGSQNLPIRESRIAAYLTESMGRIIDIAHSRSRNTLALHLNLLEQVLLLCDELRPQQKGLQLDRRVIAARDYLLEHYREKTTVEQVAVAANAAPSTLNALFKSQMGENLMRWRDQLRMHKARELLQETDKAIKVIATEVGYDDPMFFSRRFKQLTGWSPTQVRDGTSI